MRTERTVPGSASRALVRRHRWMPAAAIAAGLAFSAALAQASPINVTYTETTSSTVPGAGSGNLLLGKSPVYNDDSGGATGTTANSSNQWINDAGSTGIPLLTDGAWTFNNKGTDATVGTTTGGKTLVYNLGSATSLGQMNFYFGWNDNGRNDPSAIGIYVNPSTSVSSPTDPNWTLLSNAASPTGFTTNYYLAGTGVVAGNPGGRGSAGNTNGTVVTVTDASGGPFATNVGSIKLVFGNAENNYTGLGEINAFVTPEPSALGLAALAATSLLRRRRTR